MPTGSGAMRHSLGWWKKRLPHWYGSTRPLPRSSLSPRDAGESRYTSRRRWARLPRAFAIFGHDAMTISWIARDCCALPSLRAPPAAAGTVTTTPVFESPSLRIFYDVRHHVDRNLHAVERNRILTGLALGYKPRGEPDFGLDRQRFAKAASGYVVFLHGTARPDKQWPETSWIALGKALGRRTGVALG